MRGNVIAVAGVTYQVAQMQFDSLVGKMGDQERKQVTDTIQPAHYPLAER